MASNRKEPDFVHQLFKEEKQMTYIIAEIGQNHNGSLETAKVLIEMARDAGVSAVKFTMRDLDHELTDEVANAPYTSPNSYGDTYMEHRKKLELDIWEVSILIQYAKDIGIQIVMTFCSYTLLIHPMIKDMILPILNYIKVASRDITNTLLMDKLAEMDIPLILSSGLSNFSEMSTAIQKLYKKDVSILHCVSKYPTSPKDAYLSRINILEDRFKKHRIGYSDHTEGYRACVLAVAMGASIIEKHITLNKEGRGSDHSCSIEPAEFRDMIKEINEVNLLKGYNRMLSHDLQDDEILANRKKLMRSVCSYREIKSGDLIQYKDLCLLSPGDGIPSQSIHEIVGRELKDDLPAKTKIEWEMVK